MGISLLNQTMDIMTFRETKLSKDIEHLYWIQSYKLLTSNRNHYGGGVCMHIKDYISHNVLPHLTVIRDNIERLFAETCFMDKTVILGIIYRRPNASVTLFVDALETMLREDAVSGKTCVLLGDFNINLLNNAEGNVKLFINLLASYGFYPCINRPTRVNKRSATIIDQIWTNSLTFV